MMTWLLLQHTQATTAVRSAVTSLVERVEDDERGVVTTEWIALMVGIVALAGILAGSGLWQTVANAIVNAFSSLIDQVAGKAGGGGASA